MRYMCIDRRRTQYPVRMMCRVLKVSRSGYYAWRVRPESQRSKTDRELTRVILGIHIDSDGVYGAAKITAELKEEGHHCGRHKVARLMRKADVQIPAFENSRLYGRFTLESGRWSARLLRGR